ncbi:MAG: hypothetical protein MHPDNHAH_02123 [Anaerolineales bacterium]|nr:hypothetical protein [Anaerolineales bacterium]
MLIVAKPIGPLSRDKPFRDELITGSPYVFFKFAPCGFLWTNENGVTGESCFPFKYIRIKIRLFYPYSYTKIRDIITGDWTNG